MPKSMASFWIGVILSSALLVYSDQGVEHLMQLHCKPKPGCTLARCDPMPDRLSMIGGLSPPSHEYPILCQNEEDSSCCGKQLTTMEQNFEEMKSEFKTLKLRLEMTEKREAEARVEIALLENEKSEIKKEVENLKKESTAIKRAADENRNETKSLRDEIVGLKRQIPKMGAKVPCRGVHEEGKCFFAVIHEGEDVSLSDGDRLCGDSGGKPADILNLDHQNAVEIYIRGFISSSSSIIQLWTNMTYNTRQLQSSSGASLSLRWRGGYPSSKSKNTAVKMNVYIDVTSSDNGIYNKSPGGTAHGFICEI